MLQLYAYAVFCVFIFANVNALLFIEFNSNNTIYSKRKRRRIGEMERDRARPRRAAR